VIPNWVINKIENYVLSRESGKIEEVVKVILSEYEVDRKKAQTIVRNVLEELRYQGKVRLYEEEQIGAAPMWETVG